MSQSESEFNYVCVSFASLLSSMPAFYCFLHFEKTQFSIWIRSHKCNYGVGKSKQFSIYRRNPASEKMSQAVSHSAAVRPPTDCQWCWSWKSFGEVCNFPTRAALTFAYKISPQCHRKLLSTRGNTGRGCLPSAIQLPAWRARVNIVRLITFYCDKFSRRCWCLS